MKIPTVKFRASRKRRSAYTIPKDRKCKPRAVPRGLLTQRDSMGNTAPMSLSAEIYKRKHLCQPTGEGS